MPSTIASVMAAADLEPAGVVQWQTPVPSPQAGIYVVALTHDVGSRAGTLPEASISTEAIERWLAVRPELRLDGQRPRGDELGERLREFWLPDEVVLYIGLTTRPLRKRVDEYYKTPLGARRPHSGGHFLKTLANLDMLYVHFAPSASPAQAEDRMLKAFCNSVSDETRHALRDPSRPFPFANLELPRGVRKRHGLTGTKGDVRTSTTAARITRKGPVMTTRKSGKVTLHDEIARILSEGGNPWMTTEEIALEVDAAGKYHKKDGSRMTAFQIHGRTKNYPYMFERDGSRVRLHV